MQSGWRDGKSSTRTSRKAPRAMPTRAAPPQGEPGRLKVETGRPQVQHSSPAAPAAASHPPPGFGTGSQPCQHLEGHESCPRLCVPAPRLSSLPFPARHGPPAPAPLPRSATGAVLRRAGPGQVSCGRCRLLPLLSSPTGSGRRPCARGLPGKLRVRSGGEGMSPQLLATFPPRPSFYHSISGPSHRHSPSLLLPSLRELDSLPPPASGSPAPSLRRPHPSVSVLAAEQGASTP